jgi:hypothetical protein
MARVVLLHYHLFKNAGTSVDQLLRQNFPGGWVTREFGERDRDAHRAALARWIRDEPQAIAFSTHTGMLPPPALEGVEVIPLLFVRHPIDRIVSAYTFERRQNADTFGAVLARHTTLPGYVEVRLALAGDRQCRDFQVARLAAMFPAEAGDERDRAARALAALPFVGLVEAFDASIRRLAALLAPHYPGFSVSPVERNVSRDPRQPLAERLAAVREQLGPALHARLLALNAADLALHEAVSAVYRD